MLKSSRGNSTVAAASTASTTTIKTSSETEEKIAAAVSTHQPVNPQIIAQPTTQQPVSPEVTTVTATTTTPATGLKPKLKSSGSITSFTATANTAATEKQTLVAEQQAVYGQAETKFTIDQLNEAWMEFAEIVKVKSHSDFATLKGQRTMKSEFHIELSVANATQQENMEKLKTDLLQHVRRKLNNFSLQLSIVVNKIDDGRKMYTAQEKYVRMREINPDIEKLRTSFDLNLD